MQHSDRGTSSQRRNARAAAQAKDECARIYIGTSERACYNASTGDETGAEDKEYPNTNKYYDESRRVHERKRSDTSERCYSRSVASGCTTRVRAVMQRPVPAASGPFLVPSGCSSNHPARTQRAHVQLHPAFLPLESRYVNDATRHFRLHQIEERLRICTNRLCIATLPVNVIASVAGRRQHGDDNSNQSGHSRPTTATSSPSAN